MQFLLTDHSFFIRPPSVSVPDYSGDPDSLIRISLREERVVNVTYGIKVVAIRIVKHDWQLCNISEQESWITEIYHSSWSRQHLIGKYEMKKKKDKKRTEIKPMMAVKEPELQEALWKTKRTKFYLIPKLMGGEHSSEENPLFD